MFPIQSTNTSYDPYSWSKSLKQTWKKIVDYGNRPMPMGGTPSPGQNSGASQNLINALSNYNENAMNTVPFYGAQSPGQQWTSPTFAQVNEQDKSLDDFAARNNAPLPQVAGLNNTKTLPPKGTYLQLTQQGITQASPYAYQGPRPTPPGQQRRGDPSAQRLRVQANQIMTQWQTSGTDPASIPSAVLGFIRNANGEPLTIQKALEMGYVMNENGILVKKGSPGAPSSDNNWQTNPALRVVTWNESAKNEQNRFETTEKWAQNAIRRKMRGSSRRTPVGPKTNETPSSILDIHLGSG